LNLLNIFNTKNLPFSKLFLSPTWFPFRQLWEEDWPSSFSRDRWLPSEIIKIIVITNLTCGLSMVKSESLLTDNLMCSCNSMTHFKYSKSKGHCWFAIKWTTLYNKQVHFLYLQKDNFLWSTEQANFYMIYKTSLLLYDLLTNLAFQLLHYLRNNLAF
jgi:hypothetical protein